MNKEDFERAINIAVEIENIKEVIGMLEDRLGAKLMNGLFDARTKDKILSKASNIIMRDVLQKKVEELEKEIDNI